MTYRYSLLIAYDMDRAQRYVQVRDRRTKRHYSEFMHWLATTHYADVEKIQVVQDNLHPEGAFTLRSSKAHQGHITNRPYTTPIRPIRVKA